ncbi:MAG TPA: hypothetical protein VFV87_00015 [Pirellulaceae bacterium]|nr:hypothetical protein [Pirellulaceae bacterium]
MAIHCPYCRHKMALKDAKPGKYKPKCAKCGTRFLLTVPADGAEPVSEAIIQELRLPEGVVDPAAAVRSREDAQMLEECATIFNRAGMAKLRTPLVLGFLGLVAVLSCGGLIWSWALVAGTLALAAAAIGTYFVASGLRQRTFLFGKFRELVWMARWTDWATWIVSGILLIVILLVLGWLWMALGMAIAGMLLGLAHCTVVDGRIAAQRRQPLEEMEHLLKTLRLKGIDETALQQFVAKYSGQQWEEFFEALFGYEDKLTARKLWGRGEGGRDRPKFCGWQDPIVCWIDRRVQAFRELRDRKHLQQVEEKNLQAQGLDLITARRRAQNMADAILDEAAEARAAAAQPAAAQAVIDPKLEAAKKRQRIKTMLADAKKGAYQAKRQRMIGTALSPLAIALGGGVRFFLGCLLVIGCVLWARQNGLLSRENVHQVGSAVSASVQHGDAASLAADAQSLTSRDLRPLRIPVVGPLVSSFNAGIAGLVLIVLGLFRGWKMSLFALPATAVMLLGPAVHVPAFLSLQTVHLESIGAGLLIAAVGVVFGRTHDD